MVCLLSYNGIWCNALMKGGVTCWNSSVQIVFSKPQRRHATMRKVTVIELRWPGQDGDLLSTMLREGAQRLLAQAVRSEFEEFFARFAADRDACDRAAVVRNGHQPERRVLTGPRSVAVRIPQAHSRTQERVKLTCNSTAHRRANETQRLFELEVKIPTRFIVHTPLITDAREGFVSTPRLKRVASPCASTRPDPMKFP
jgi:hypothetical protein